MATTEDTIIVEIRKAIAAIATPEFVVREELALDPLTARDGDVFVVVDRLSFDPSAGETRRWHLDLLIFARAKIVSATSSTSAYAEVFAAARAILDALQRAAALQGGGSAGVESLRRGELQTWFKPGGAVGQPAGALLPVTVTWKQ